MLINLTILQRELNLASIRADAVSIEFMPSGELQFRGGERCYTSDYTTLLAVATQQNVVGAGEDAVHRAIAKHILTRLLLQRKSLATGTPCAEPVLA